MAEKSRSFREGLCNRVVKLVQYFNAPLTLTKAIKRESYVRICAIPNPGKTKCE